MSQTTATPPDIHAAGHAGHGHDPHDCPPHHAHHFDTPEQQVASGKVGMWVFLATEILMFGGLFCAYAIYRANHRDIYDIGHHVLDTTWGAINTGVLIASSFTMAWAVRTAQLNKRMATTVLLALTLLGGLGFMLIKKVEYTHKFHGYVLPFSANAYRYIDVADPNFSKYLPTFMGAAEEYELHSDSKVRKMKIEKLKDDKGVEKPAVYPRHDLYAPEPDVLFHGAKYDEYKKAKEAAPKPSLEGLNPNYVEPGAKGPAASPVFPSREELAKCRNFFAIYFMLTGLHGIHVLVGMGLIAWILVRNMRGQFTELYNAPVDLVGLYWHLVDLIWIFLFPLLYLID